VKILMPIAGPGSQMRLRQEFCPYFTTKPSVRVSAYHKLLIVKRHGGMASRILRPRGEVRLYLPATEGKLSVPAIRTARQCWLIIRILVMDDEAAIRDLTSQLLGTPG
jgi:hypothetical protein